MKWYALALNPEPWAIGDVSIGRKNGHYTGNVGPNKQLVAFQEAVREELGIDNGLITGKVEMVFYFWRNRPEYTTQNQRKHRKHEADATNMQKALEDALQGVLFVNDRDTNHIESWIVAQGPDVEGKIVFGIQEVPDSAAAAIATMPTEALVALEELAKREAKGPSDLQYGKGGMF